MRTEVLEALDIVLGLDERFVKKLIEYDGANTILKLKFHDCKNISEAAQKIVDKYLEEGDADVEDDQFDLNNQNLD